MVFRLLYTPAGTTREHDVVSLGLEAAADVLERETDNEEAEETLQAAWESAHGSGTANPSVGWENERGLFVLSPV